jgi:hypothetical protein
MVVSSTIAAGTASACRARMLASAASATSARIDWRPNSSASVEM